MSNPNPDETPKSPSWQKALFEWTDFALKAILIIGGVVAIYQYFDVKQDNRVKQTMEQLQRFNNNPLLDARLTLTKTWTPYQSTFQRLNQQTIANEQDQMQILGKIVIPVIQQHDLFDEIILLVDFFDNLHICIQHHLCDQQVAEAFFSGYARSFYRLHQPWIMVQRQAVPSFACHLEAFIYPQQQGCQ